jgi:hypothetical protein
MDDKKLKQRATHTSLPFSPKAPQNEKITTTYKPKSWLKIQPPPPIYRPFGKHRSTPTLGHTTQALIVAFWSTHDVVHRAFTSSQCKLLDHAACGMLRSYSARLDHASARRASYLGFVAQPSNTDGFVVNHRKPHGLGAASAPMPLMIWLPRHPDSVLVVWPNQQTIMLGFVEQPRDPTVFWCTTENPACKLQPHHAKHRARQAFHLCIPNGLLSLAPFYDLAATLHRLDLGFEAQPKNCTQLHIAFLAIVRPALDPVRPLGPSSRAY